jgi:hypothetical protein
MEELLVVEFKILTSCCLYAVNLRKSFGVGFGRDFRHLQEHSIPFSCSANESTLNAVKSKRLGDILGDKMISRAGRPECAAVRASGLHSQRDQLYQTGLNWYCP